MKPCCELFYHFYTKQGQIIYQTNTMFKYKNDKIPIFLDLLCTDTIGCYHMIEKYTKIMLQVMYYQFYAVFLGIDDKCSLIFAINPHDD